MHGFILCSTGIYLSTRDLLHYKAIIIFVDIIKSNLCIFISCTFSLSTEIAKINKYDPLKWVFWKISGW